MAAPYKPSINPPVLFWSMKARRDHSPADLGILLCRCTGQAHAGIDGLQAINHKRFYRVTKASSLLLQKAPKHPVSSFVHDGVVTIGESNQRCCSDDFEIACDNDELVTCVFMKDCCDRELIDWARTGYRASAHIGAQLAVEWHRRTLREHIQKGFCESDGPLQRRNCSHATGRRF